MLLSDPIKLRSSTSIDSFLDARWIPHRYGDLSKSPQSLVQLSDTLFIYGEGACRVDGVQISGQQVQGFNWRVGPDSTGKTVTFVELASPLPSGEEITATGYGKPSLRDGRTIENPADVLSDLFVWNEYRVTPQLEVALSRLRAQCAAEDLRIGGSVQSGGTLRAAINEIVRSIGGGWSVDAFWLHPQRDLFSSPPSTMASRFPNAIVERCEASRQNLFGELRVEFDDQSYQARHRQALVMRARPSYDARRSNLVLLAPWLRSQSAAMAVAKRYLSRGAARVYEVQLNVDMVADLARPGDVFALESPKFPVSGLQWLTVIAVYRRGAAATLICELLLPNANQVFDIVSRTVTGDVTQLPSVELEVRDGSVRFTVFDDDGKPLAKTRVSLAGSTVRLTDANGLAVFPKPPEPGVYTLYVYRTGSVPVEIPVSIP